MHDAVDHGGGHGLVAELRDLIRDLRTLVGDDRRVLVGSSLISAARPVFTPMYAGILGNLLSSPTAIQATQAEAVCQTWSAPMIPMTRFRRSVETLHAGEFFQ